MTKVAHKRNIMLFWSGMVTNKKLIVSVTILVILLGLIASGFFYYKYDNAQKELLGIRSGMTDSEKEIKMVVSEVGKLMELPTGEDPEIRIVSDIEKLRDQEFFKRAKNGDKVLIYIKAKKAILYDPVTKKIIDVAPINTGTGSAQTSTPTPLPSLSEVKVVLRNGTDISGLATKTGTQVKNAIPEAVITKKENASRFDYKSTLVVVINENAKSYAEKLVSSFGGSISQLPQGESNAEGADLLVILGQDKAQ